MQSKAKQSNDVGTFCQLLITKMNGTWNLSPDYIRLKNRFEVTNGASSIHSETLEARRMSYCMMLGKTLDV